MRPTDGKKLGSMDTVSMGQRPLWSTNENKHEKLEVRLRGTLDAEELRCWILESRSCLDYSCSVLDGQGSSETPGLALSVALSEQRTSTAS